MSVFQTFFSRSKINIFRKSLKLPVPVCKCTSVRRFSDVPSKKFVSFDEIVEQRRAEAKRSIVVQVNSEKSFSELHGYCSKYADVKGMHHYKNSAEEHFILVEFSTQENLKDVIKACSSHHKDPDVMALQSPFLWFRAAQDKKKYPLPEGITLVTENADMIDNEDVLYESLMNCNTVSEQIQMLYDRTVLNDVGIRLRYIVAMQMENLFESMYTNIVVRPFGSTVNGFGKLGCDLDLVLTNLVTEEMCDPSKRLVFQDKRCDRGLRPWSRHMELVGAGLELRAVGVGRVTRVPHARVPIVQCTQQYADLDVDLCYNNMSGVYMSELLWSLGSLDARVRPLVFAVRRWAQTVGLTNPNPGRWITNFPLTLLVLHFLQQKTKDGFILPSVKTLVRNAGKADVRIAEDDVNCTFARAAPLPRDVHSQSDTDLETSLLQFFEFYAQFDFQEKAVSLLEGRGVRKPDAQPLYIVNPLEPALNVSKNVSFEECDRLKAEVRNAAWQLEGRGGRGEGWGLLGLVERGSMHNLKQLVRAGNAQRLVSVRDLFKEENESQEQSLGEKLRKLVQKSNNTVKETFKPNPQMTNAKDKKGPTKFKNSQIASEVFRIRRNKIV